MLELSASPCVNHAAKKNTLQKGIRSARSAERTLGVDAKQNLDFHFELAP